MAPFDAVAESYDETFTWSRIGLAQRAAVHRELDSAFLPGQRILEINCGTGVDAIHLGRQGISVVACDASARMISLARERTGRTELKARPQFHVLSTERIAALVETEGRGTFDGALSNFAGLNCVEDLAAVSRELAMLLKPDATVFLCMFGRLCAWEILWYLARGKPRKAFRRLRSKGDIAELSQGVTVRVHYPSVSALARLFSPNFRLTEWKGVGVAVPPTYLESLGSRFPKLLEALSEADRWLASCPVLRAMADHVLVRLERVRT
jgi:ubiquinone/menaquinone biosynthesis C-methylase UbiE